MPCYKAAVKITTGNGDYLGSYIIYYKNKTNGVLTIGSIYRNIINNLDASKPNNPKINPFAPRNTGLTLGSSRQFFDNKDTNEPYADFDPAANNTNNGKITLASAIKAGIPVADFKIEIQSVDVEVQDVGGAECWDNQAIDPNPTNPPNPPNPTPPTSPPPPPPTTIPVDEAPARGCGNCLATNDTELGDLFDPAGDPNIVYDPKTGIMTYTLDITKSDKEYFGIYTLCNSKDSIDLLIPTSLCNIVPEDLRPSYWSDNFSLYKEAMEASDWFIKTKDIDTYIGGVLEQNGTTQFVDTVLPAGAPWNSSALYTASSTIEDGIETNRKLPLVTYKGSSYMLPSGSSKGDLPTGFPWQKITDESVNYTRGIKLDRKNPGDDRIYLYGRTSGGGWKNPPDTITVNNIITKRRVKYIVYFTIPSIKGQYTIETCKNSVDTTVDLTDTSSIAPYVTTAQFENFVPPENPDKKTIKGVIIKAFERFVTYSITFPSETWTRNLTDGKALRPNTISYSRSGFRNEGNLKINISAISGSSHGTTDIQIDNECRDENYREKMNSPVSWCRLCMTAGEWNNLKQQIKSIARKSLFELDAIAKKAYEEAISKLPKNCKSRYCIMSMIMDGVAGSEQTYFVVHKPSSIGTKTGRILPPCCVYRCPHRPGGDSPILNHGPGIFRFASRPDDEPTCDDPVHQGQEIEGFFQGHYKCSVDASHIFYRKAPQIGQPPPPLVCVFHGVENPPLLPLPNYKPVLIFPLGPCGTPSKD